MLVLFTDTDTDVSKKMAEELGFKLLSMPYSIGEKNIYPYVDFEEFDCHEFYEMLRKGVMPKTSALNPQEYIDQFEPYFKDGHDILYVHFSQNMSGTFNAMNLAYMELKEKYPERKLYTIDTKGISLCSMMIVKEISRLFYKEGKTVEEILAWAEEEIEHYPVYFFSEDLQFFARSGRVSNFAAFVGGIIGLNPIIHMSSDGFLKTIAKGRGKNNTIAKILNYVKELAIDIDKHKVYIGHTDKEDVAIELKDKLIAEFGELDIEFVNINPTIGAHCGPSTVGVAFYGKHR